ncbi:MAG: hypothetical protein KGY65_01415 [Candidatus Thermoplasmatota archaeon]|nr:hypothetical protein [Candidatus Thermoplasmatota archaeon]MBS3801388.1 hypothetical protein [Candidatus Thermoplasmatota archaeon]
MPNKSKSVIAIFFVSILLVPTIIPSAKAGFFSDDEKIVKVAFIWQRWDILDLPARIMMMMYKRILRQAEKEYDVNIQIFEFWDRWRGGDVQSGKLEKYDIDVVVGPGGVGGWNSPRAYRVELKKFVRNGGGFYGICGDSTFGSLGVVNLPTGYKKPLKKAIGERSFTPMLGLANVYTDASAFDHILKYPFWFKRADMIKLVGQLPISRAPIKIQSADLPIQEPYARSRVRVMMGNAPLVDGPIILRLFMPKVHDIAVFRGSDNPYDDTIKGKKAIVATHYGRGRVVLSVPHPELTVGNSKAHDLFARNLLWCSKSLPVRESLKTLLKPWMIWFVSDYLEHEKLIWFLLTLQQASE